jgi:4-hydroxybenzoate polyprenyltransferase
MGFAAAMGGPSLAAIALQTMRPHSPFAVSAPLVLLPWPPLLLYAGGVFWTLGYDTIYAVQDMEDDALIGVKSSALRLGAAAPRAVALFYALAWGLSLAAGVLARLGPLFWVGAAAYGVHLARQARRLRMDDPAGALGLFRSNTAAGLILLAAVIAGAWRP